MVTLNGNYKFSDGLNYYELALNLKNGEKVMIKNASCSAHALELAGAYWNTESKLFNDSDIKLFFLGTSDEFSSLKKIPKKYHKYFITKK